MFVLKTLVLRRWLYLRRSFETVENTDLNHPVVRATIGINRVGLDLSVTNRRIPPNVIKSSFSALEKICLPNLTILFTMRNSNQILTAVPETALV